MKQSCFDKHIPHSFMASGKFLVCANCGKKRAKRHVVRRSALRNPPDWAPWQQTPDGDAEHVPGTPQE